MTLRVVNSVTMRGFEMATRTVTVEEIHQGAQLRAYGDHVYEGYLTFSVPEGQMQASKFGSTESIAKQYLRCFVSSFFEKDREWHQPWLEKLEQISPLRWHYEIRSPYLD